MSTMPNMLCLYYACTIPIYNHPSLRYRGGRVVLVEINITEGIQSLSLAPCRLCLCLLLFGVSLVTILLNLVSHFDYNYFLLCNSYSCFVARRLIPGY